MSGVDWSILIITLLGIILYGIYKSRVSHSLDGYFLNNRSMPWYIVLLGIMGTQASAVTFLSIPGQAHSDGMRFVQNYFGLPLAMVVICIFFVPVFSRLKVITAYEFLERRFDSKTRTFTSFLFLLSRGLSTGISICAPSIALSTLLGWNIYYTNILMGGLLIIYTISGGARAVAHTQKLQMILVFIVLAMVGVMLIKYLPHGVSLSTALKDTGKMNVITTGFTEKGFDWKDKFNIWSGLIGGFFLSLSYFGTDHSQVGRYITAASEKESKKGLLLNGLVKVPMQFFILLLGVLVFSFYQYHQPPVFFDEVSVARAKQTEKKDSLVMLETNFKRAFENGDKGTVQQLRKDYAAVITRAIPENTPKDTNYIFLRFAKDQLPMGLTGLIIAIIFLSAWGSISAALNSLSACTVVDFHKKFINTKSLPEKDFRISQWYTLGWGIFCIGASMLGVNIGNSLIEAVNILGSLFYGVILGIFLVAFWIRFVKGRAVFVSAIAAEGAVILIYKWDIVSFLWLNVIGALLVIIFSLLLQVIFPQKSNIAR